MALIDAAALVPLHRDADGDVRLVLIRRAEGGIHGGHLAFPGGKLDPQDASMQDAALREAWEEIGLPRERVEVLAALPPIETRTSGFRIHPFLGRIQGPVVWQPAPREVAEVVEVRLAELAEADAHCAAADASLSPLQTQRVPFYRVGRFELWGASYRILHPLLPRLLAGEWPM
jgi:8-oxo-dGTP pyrophosphatase MutT (NUDIX family)